MARRKYTGLCVDCDKRQAMYPVVGVEAMTHNGNGNGNDVSSDSGAPGLCGRCWRRRRYNDPNDDYKQRSDASKLAWRERRQLANKLAMESGE